MKSRLLRGALLCLLLVTPQIIAYEPGIPLDVPVAQVSIEETPEYQKAANCLATNIYYEARGEPLAGQVAVAFVVYNRADGDLSKVCSVVYESAVRNGKKVCQFSWTCLINASRKIKNEVVYDICLEISRGVLNHKIIDPAHGADHYHEKSIHPRWGDKNKMVAQIGHHLFYKLD